MNKLHFIPVVLIPTSCFAEIKNGEFAINLSDKDKKENFVKTFNSLKDCWNSIISSPKEGVLKNNNVYFSIEKDKIKLHDLYDNNNDKYFFYQYSIKNYVTLKEQVYNTYNLMNNKHEINDIKTFEVVIDIPEDYINSYKYLPEKIEYLKKDLFNNKDYGFLIFNDAYSKYIKENHRSFNIELKDGKFVITANKEYVEKNDSVVEHKYYIKVFIDPNKTKDCVVNDKYKDSNLEEIKVFTYSLGKEMSADDLIEDFKKYRYNLGIEGYKLCDDKGNEITGNNLKAGTYYVKNDRFFTKKLVIELYHKFLKYLNENLVNGVEKLISKDSITEEDFKKNMTAINEFLDRFSIKESKIYKKYESLLKDSNYGAIIDEKFDSLNELRRKLMAMYMYKSVIANVNSIINKLKTNNFNDLNIDDFFTNDCNIRDYSNNFILKIYEKFKGEFIKGFLVNGIFYTNDVKKHYKEGYECNNVRYEISNCIGHKEFDNFSNLEEELEKLLKENKDNLFNNVYKISADTTNLKESTDYILENLIREISYIQKEALYTKDGCKLSYGSLLCKLKLYRRFYEDNHNRVLFFDIFVDGNKVVFDYTKKIKELYDEVLPQGKHTILLKFYDCVEAYNEYSSKLEDDAFYNLLIAQIARKDYEEKEIEKINKITSLAELKTNYEKLIKEKYDYRFYNNINAIIGVSPFKYKHSDESDKNYIKVYELPKVIDAVVAKLQQLEEEGMSDEDRKVVEEIESKYKEIVDKMVNEINSTNVEELVQYSKKEDISTKLEGDVKKEVADYDVKKSKISNFEIFIRKYVEQVYDAYNTKSSVIVKDERKDKPKATEERVVQPNINTSNKNKGKMLKSNIKKKTCYGGCRNRRKINIIQTRKKEVTLF